MTARIGIAAFAALLSLAGLALQPAQAQTETTPAVAAAAAGTAPAAAPPAAAASDEGVIGTLIEVEGSATVTPDGGETVAAAVDGPVHLNDEIKTAAGAKVFILFIDNTQVTLSENTSMKIDDYVFDPDSDKENKARYSMLEGSFQYVSGLIGHKQNPDVKIEAPVGSIGIRGTDFWAGNLDDKYSVAVNEGQVGVKTDKGPESVVNKGEGTEVAGRHFAPARAHAWSPEKFQRAAGTVHLARRDWVRQRVGQMQERHQALRGRYKEYMNQHRNGGRWDNHAMRGGRGEGLRGRREGALGHGGREDFGRGGREGGLGRHGREGGREGGLGRHGREGGREGGFGRHGREGGREGGFGRHGREGGREGGRQGGFGHNGREGGHGGGGFFGNHGGGQGGKAGSGGKGGGFGGFMQGFGGGGAHGGKGGGFSFGGRGGHGGKGGALSGKKHEGRP